jgi:hypothetical protein
MATQEACLSRAEPVARMAWTAVAALLLSSLAVARAEDDAAPSPANWGSPSVDGGARCASLAEARRWRVRTAWPKASPNAAAARSSPRSRT